VESRILDFFFHVLDGVSRILVLERWREFYTSSFPFFLFFGFVLRN
jgi:hypothetical protein